MSTSHPAVNAGVDQGRNVAVYITNYYARSNYGQFNAPAGASVVD